MPLYAAVFNQPPWRDGWSEPVAGERLRLFAQHPHFHGLGLLQGNAPIALVLGVGERWVDGWIFQLKEMCVAPELQRAGVGHELLAGLEEILKPRGYVAISLQTGSNSPARHFYESAGYEQFGIVSLQKRLSA